MKSISRDQACFDARISCRRLVWCRCCGWPRQLASTTSWRDCRWLRRTRPRRPSRWSAGCSPGGLIDDLDLLRHGGMGRLLEGVRAPSTLARSCGPSPTARPATRQGRRGAAGGLAAHVPGLLTGGGGRIAFIDLDDTIKEVHVTPSRPRRSVLRRPRPQRPARHDQHPDRGAVIARARLRRGAAASASGCGRLLAQAIGTARAAGATGRSWPEQTRPTTATTSSGPRSATAPGSA